MNTSKLIRRCRFLSILLTVVLLLVLGLICVRTHNTAAERARLNSAARGSIFDADGNALAWSLPGDGERYYLNGEAGSALVGYISRSHGSDGIERLYDGWLSPAGSDSEHGDIYLTVRSDAMQTCYESLADAPVGAAIVMDIDRGAIIAAADTPSFEPRELDSDYNGVVSRGCVFYNICASKNITAGPMFRICSGGAACSAGDITLVRELLGGQFSAGDAPAQPDAVEKALYDRMLIGQDIELDCVTLRSAFAPKDGFASAQERADALAGYGSTQISPMQICMYTAAAARDDGSIIRPYAVSGTVSRDGQTVSCTGGEVLSDGAFTAEARAAIYAAMTEYSGSCGTFRAMTARVATGGQDNIWLTAMAPAADPQFALTVVMQGDQGVLNEADVLAAAEEIFNSVL